MDAKEKAEEEIKNLEEKISGLEKSKKEKYNVSR